MKKIILLSVIFLLLTGGTTVLAYQPNVAYLQKGNIQINNPEVSQNFFDELKGSPRDYFITSDKDFELYINLLVPEIANRDGRYSANIFLENPSTGSEQAAEENVAVIDGSTFSWQETYNSFDRDYYLKGPEFDKQVSAGKYKIEVFSPSTGSGQANNQGKYVLAIGKKQSYDVKGVLNTYWQLPLLKIMFLQTSVLQFFLTPFGVAGVGAIGGLIILFALLNYLIGLIKEKFRQRIAKTVLLTSAGMQMKSEIIKLLQKPAYDVTVAFISTAAKPLENVDFVKKDWDIMKEMGFNIEEVDIEGKTESQVMNLLRLKDIIFVEGGNTFFLLSMMRKCKFEKVIKNLLKEGKVYIGVSAGSMVAGMTIDTANWKNDDKNIVNLKNLRGLNLVPFNVFVHYLPEHAQLVQQKIQKSKYPLRILTDNQAILSQGKNTLLLGDEPENVFVKKESIIKILFRIILALIVLLLIGFVVYAFLNGNLVLPQ